MVRAVPDGLRLSEGQAGVCCCPVSFACVSCAGVIPLTPIPCARSIGHSHATPVGREGARCGGFPPEFRLNSACLLRALARLPHASRVPRRAARVRAHPRWFREIGGRFISRNRRGFVGGRRYEDDGLAGLRRSCEKPLVVVGRPCACVRAGDGHPAATRWVATRWVATGRAAAGWVVVNASVVFEGFLGGDGDAWMSWDNAANGLLCFRDGGAYGPCSKQRSRPTPAFRRALSFVSWDNRRTVPRCFAPSHASRRGDQASAGRVRALGILERPARKGASPACHARSAEAPSRLGVLRVFRRPCAWPASRVSRDWSVASRLELGVPPFASEGRALACCGRRSPCDDAGDSRHVI